MARKDPPPSPLSWDPSEPCPLHQLPESAQGIGLQGPSVGAGLTADPFWLPSLPLVPPPCPCQYWPHSPTDPLSRLSWSRISSGTAYIKATSMRAKGTLFQITSTCHQAPRRCPCQVGKEREENGFPRAKKGRRMGREATAGGSKAEGQKRKRAA